MLFKREPKLARRLRAWNRRPWRRSTTVQPCNRELTTMKEKYQPELKANDCMIHNAKIVPWATAAFKETKIKGKNSSDIQLSHNLIDSLNGWTFVFDMKFVLLLQHLNILTQTDQKKLPC